MTSLAALVSVYGDRSDYAYEVTGDGVDTVRVWDSNFHAGPQAMRMPVTTKAQRSAEGGESGNIVKPECSKFPAKVRSSLKAAII